MQMVKEFLKEHDYEAEIINGSVTEKNRTRIFNEFQNGSLECLVAHPQTASHGLNLTASATIIWFAPIFSVEHYLQANNRISRPGHTKHMTIAHILSTPLEAGLYRALWGKIQMQNAILSQYEEILK
jgi:SNF2 family DNA or RNA helicase